MGRALYLSFGPIYSHSPQRIRNTFKSLQQHLPLPPSKNFLTMPKSIIKHSGVNRTTRAGLTGPLVRKCHTFRRDGYINEPNFDMEGYEADRDERRNLWRTLRAEKADNRYSRSIDRAVFRDLYHFTCEIWSRKCIQDEHEVSFPYTYTEATFANTVANIAFFKADRIARDELFKTEKIVIGPGRAERRRLAKK